MSISSYKSVRTWAPLPGVSHAMWISWEPDHNATRFWSRELDDGFSCLEYAMHSWRGNRDAAIKVIHKGACSLCLVTLRLTQISSALGGIPLEVLGNKRFLIQQTSLHWSLRNIYIFLKAVETEGRSVGKNRTSRLLTSRTTQGGSNIIWKKVKELWITIKAVGTIKTLMMGEECDQSSNR